MIVIPLFTQEIRLLLRIIYFSVSFNENAYNKNSKNFEKGMRELRVKL